MTPNKVKLQRWLDMNPNGFDTKTMSEIAKESDTNVSAVESTLPELIARRDGIMPSEVKKRRAYATRRHVNKERVYELHDEGKSTDDIAFIMECTTKTVRNILNNRP